MTQKKSNFNQALWLGIGQLCTFLLSFVSAAILSRYFDKTEYGTYKQILYVYNILYTVFAVGLPSVFAYFIPRLTTGQQKALIGGINRLFVFLGLLFSLSLYFLSGPIASLLKNPELAIGLKIFAPFPLFTLPAIGVEGIYTALKKTKAIAVYHIIVKTAMLFCIVLPVIWFNTGYRGAILGWGAASFVGFLIAMWLKNSPYMGIEKETIPDMYRSVLSFSLPLMGASVAGLTISAAYQFYVSRYYGTETFADFSNGAFSIPIVAMIATSVKSVLLPVFSKADADGNLNSAVTTYKNSVTRSITLIFPVLLYFMFFADDFVVFMFGEKYEVSAIYMRFHILRDFIDVFPYYAVLLAIGQSRIYMHVHVVVAALTWVVGFGIVSLALPAYIFVLNSSLLEILLRLFCFFYIFRIRRFNLLSRDLLAYAFRVTLHCGLCLTVIYAMRHILFPQLGCMFSLFISFSIYGLMAVGSEKIVKIDYLESVKTILKHKKKA